MTNVVSIDDYHANKNEQRIFVKMYVDAVRSGMIGDMGAEKWQTLCLLASYMDEDGECYPTQYAVAERLGVARETANRRIKALCDYRWQGRPVIEKVEQRRDHEKQTFDNVMYRILPNSGLSIF